MYKTLTCIVLIFILTGSLFGQVEEIKRAASAASSSVRFEGGGSSSLSGSGIVVDIFFNLMFSGVVSLQQHRLHQREKIPAIVSLDLMLQGGGQPSSYYIIHPRIRGNWGLFSTDFRFNYLIEEDFDGMKHIRTNDWQVLQLNLISTRDVTIRIGGGVLHEAFEGTRSYGEWTAALQLQPAISKCGGTIEYRGSSPRKEVNAHLQYHLFDKGILHGFATAGVVYQRYYEDIKAWGLQGGFVCRLY